MIILQALHHELILMHPIPITKQQRKVSIKSEQMEHNVWDWAALAIARQEQHLMTADVHHFLTSIPYFSHIIPGLHK